MPGTERFRINKVVSACVTGDVLDHIAERFRNLVGHGRRITVTTRYTYDTVNPPEVATGLALDPDHPFHAWSIKGGNCGFTVRCRPGITAGFGVSTSSDVNEAAAWIRYRNDGDQLQDLTNVTINGGRHGDGPHRDDLIVINEWDSHRVCTQTVVAFDNTMERPRFTDPHVAWLRGHRDLYPAGSDAWKALDAAYLEYLRQAAVQKPLTNLYAGTAADMELIDQMIPTELRRRG